jgi:two-component system, cell cycle response regulator DivK
VRDFNKKAQRILVIQHLSNLSVENKPLETNSSRNLESSTASQLQTVLLVEDTEDNRQMMRKLLELSGYRVVEAVNGEEAVRVAAEAQPDVILMDLSLPLIDGLAATRRIRSMPGLKVVPIIAVSAHDTADFHADALAAGCDAYITKPIDYVELEELVSRLLVSGRRGK